MICYNGPQRGCCSLQILTIVVWPGNSFSWVISRAALNHAVMHTVKQWDWNRRKAQRLYRFINIWKKKHQQKANCATEWEEGLDNKACSKRMWFRARSTQWKVFHWFPKILDRSQGMRGTLSYTFPIPFSIWVENAVFSMNGILLWPGITIKMLTLGILESRNPT